MTGGDEHSGRKRVRKRARKSKGLEEGNTAAAVEPKEETGGVPAGGLVGVNPHKPSFVARRAGGRAYTLSVAVPGSIVRNAQTAELQSRLAGHLARACAIFRVDEIVVFDEGDVRADTGHDGSKPFDPHPFLARVLQYLETPQYLRKALFPMHPDLRLAGLMPPLDCPHHLRFDDQSEYREGVTVDPPNVTTVQVNVGLRDPVPAQLPTATKLEPGTRVTVRMPTPTAPARIVSPREPVECRGLYWGYSVRLASSLSAALTTCPFAPDAAYDLLIGTSERGVPVADLLAASTSGTTLHPPEGQPIAPVTNFTNALIVFGGLSGLELAVEADQGIHLDRNSAHQLFDAWVNVVDNQGSRTVRTEEAITIALARLQPLLEQAGARPAS